MIPLDIEKNIESKFIELNKRIKVGVKAISKLQNNRRSYFLDNNFCFNQKSFLTISHQEKHWKLKNVLCNYLYEILNVK